MFNWDIVNPESGTIYTKISTGRSSLIDHISHLNYIVRTIMSNFENAINIDATHGVFNYNIPVSSAESKPQAVRDYDDPAGKIWSIYVAESEKFDRALVESWKGDMDGMLIFVCIHTSFIYVK